MYGRCLQPPKDLLMVTRSGGPSAAATIDKGYLRRKSKASDGRSFQGPNSHNVASSARDADGTSRACRKGSSGVDITTHQLRTLRNYFTHRCFVSQYVPGSCRRRTHGGKEKHISVACAAMKKLRRKLMPLLPLQAKALALAPTMAELMLSLSQKLSRRRHRPRLRRRWLANVTPRLNLLSGRTAHCPFSHQYIHCRFSYRRVVE